MLPGARQEFSLLESAVFNTAAQWEGKGERKPEKDIQNVDYAKISKEFKAKRGNKQELPAYHL
jgi:hypothetical protein